MLPSVWFPTSDSRVVLSLIYVIFFYLGKTRRGHVIYITNLHCTLPCVNERDGPNLHTLLLESWLSIRYMLVTTIHSNSILFKGEKGHPKRGCTFLNFRCTFVSSCKSLFTSRARFLTFWGVDRVSKYWSLSPLWLNIVYLRVYIYSRGQSQGSGLLWVQQDVLNPFQRGLLGLWAWSKSISLEIILVKFISKKSFLQ